MKLRSIALGAGALVLVAGSACSADWLHRTYTGSFTAHNRTYKVDTDGTITVSEKVPGNGWVSTCCQTVGCQCNGSVTTFTNSATLIDETDLTLKNEQELDDLISDLQKVQKSLQAMDQEK